MTNIKNIILAVALFAIAACTPAIADNYFETADSSPAFRVWNGGTGVVVVAITTNGAGADMSVTTDGLATTIDGSGNTDTIAELGAAVAACTNRDGTFTLTVDTSTSLAADSTDGELLDGVYTGAANAWLEIPWDTSAALHYSVSRPQAPLFARGTVIDRAGVAVGGKVSRVYGEPTGTGNVTLSIYVAGSLKYQKTYVSPQYVLGAGNTNVADAVVSLDVEPGIPYGPQDAVIVRAARATTATTGNLGVITEPKY